MRIDVYTDPQDGNIYCYHFFGFHEYKLRQVEPGRWDVMGKFENGQLVIEAGHWPE